MDQDSTLASLPDEDVLALAADQQRILATHNVKDFASIIRGRMEAGYSHAGCILITFPHTAYGTILRGLSSTFAARPRQEDWKDRTEFLAGSE